MIFIIAIIAIVICVIIILLVINRDAILREISRRECDKVSADKYNIHAKIALNTALKMSHPNINDEIRIARILQHNRNDINASAKHYRRAIDMIIEDPPKNYNYILDRITYFTTQAAQNQAQTQTQTQTQTHNQIPQQLPNTRPNAIPNARPNARPNVELNNQELPNYTTRAIATQLAEITPIIRRDTATRMGNMPLSQRITYHNDAQNVHDTQINNDLRDQIKKMSDENDTSIGNTYEYVRNIILNANDKTPEKRAKAIDVLDSIEKNNSLVLAINMRESDVLKLVCDRIESSFNKEHRDDMKNMLIDALNDCMENGHLVCVNGRVNHIVSSLATLDASSDIGMLRTKEILRNECFEKAAEIRNKILDESPEMMKQYNNGNEEISDKIRKSIENILISTYANKIKKDDLDVIIIECKASI